MTREARTSTRTPAITTGTTPCSGPEGVYVFDFAMSRLWMLESLPHVGAFVGEDDEECVNRPAILGDHVNVSSQSHLVDSLSHCLRRTVRCGTVREVAGTPVCGTHMLQR